MKALQNARAFLFLNPSNISTSSTNAEITEISAREADSFISYKCCKKYNLIQVEILQSFD